MKGKRIFIFNFLALIIFSSCEESRFDVDVSEEKVEVEWLRFDREFTELATHDFESYNDSLNRVYGSFYRLYSERVMNFGDINSPNYKRSVMAFFNG